MRNGREGGAGILPGHLARGRGIGGAGMGGDVAGVSEFGWRVAGVAEGYRAQ